MERFTVFGLGASVFTLLLVSGSFALGFVWYCVLAATGRRPRSAEQEARGETVFLPLFVREYWDWTITPVTRFLIRRRASPNALTVLSLVLSAASAGAFLVGYYGLAGWLYLTAGTFDMFDGKVARALGIASKSGAFIDSTLDRYGEIVVLAALALRFEGTPVAWAALAALGGSLMVSYTRARGEGLGVSCREGGMQRAERIVYLGLAGIFGKVAEAAWPTAEWGAILTAVALTLLAVSANVAALQRFFFIVRELKGREEDARGGEAKSDALRRAGR